MEISKLTFICTEIYFNISTVFVTFVLKYAGMALCRVCLCVLPLAMAKRWVLQVKVKKSPPTAMQPRAPLNPNRPEYRESWRTATDNPAPHTHTHRQRYTHRQRHTHTQLELNLSLSPCCWHLGITHPEIHHFTLTHTDFCLFNLLY